MFCEKEKAQKSNFRRQKNKTGSIDDIDKVALKISSESVISVAR